MDKSLPSIPAKRYFTIGEVSDLCGVKPYVLRYWEQEFTQLKPMKRRGNRRYYKHHEVLLIRRIRDLLYDQGFTISGARNQLTDGVGLRGSLGNGGSEEMASAFKREADGALLRSAEAMADIDFYSIDADKLPIVLDAVGKLSIDQVRAELLSIRETLLV